MRKHLLLGMAIVGIVAISTFTAFTAGKQAMKDSATTPIENNAPAVKGTSDVKDEESATVPVQEEAPAPAEETTSAPEPSAKQPKATAPQSELSTVQSTTPSTPQLQTPQPSPEPVSEPTLQLTIPVCDEQQLAAAKAEYEQNLAAAAIERDDYIAEAQAIYDDELTQIEQRYSDIWDPSTRESMRSADRLAAADTLGQAKSLANTRYQDSAFSLLTNYHSSIPVGC